ncbi:alpha/beta-hydrolase [Biscogniauxia marginata]|nr:alpha/beta-hydrolase [Biscogniauxia marginata]
MASRYEPFECKTLDGTTIRCWFYPVDRPAPAVIMSHGFHCIKELSLGPIAEMFQSRGYNVLLYDARSIGASEGMPRNEVDPYKMSEDLSDIITHVSALPTVDSDHIFLWGMSLGGTVSGLCAAIDIRPRGLIMVCPHFSFIIEAKRKTLCKQLVRDRISQLRGNAPLTLLSADSRGECPSGIAGPEAKGGLEWYEFMQKSAAKGLKGFTDSTTLQTYRKLALARPKEVIKELLQEVPVLMIVPEHDNMSSPDEQKEVFESLKAPKRLYLAKGAKHLTVFSGQRSEEIIKVMEKFLKDTSKAGWKRQEDILAIL